MEKEVETTKILGKLKEKKVGVFCDGSNLFFASKENHWQIDLGKLKEFFEKCYDLQFINYYLTIPAKNDSDYYGTQNFIEKISPFVSIKSKDLKYIPIGSQIMKKGNMDVEIVLDVVRTIKNLDVVIIMSGDSDFLELGKYVIKENGKHIIYMSYERSMSWELRKCWHIFLENIKEKIILT